MMKYLQESQHYEKRYDLHTIEMCLGRIKMLGDVGEKMEKVKELRHLSEEKKQRSFNYLFNSHLLEIKVRRYKERTETIEGWIETDRVKQDKYENTPEPPSIQCDKCECQMHSPLRILEYGLDEPTRVLFFFECDKCKKRKGVYDSGEVHKSSPNLCNNCGSKLNSEYKRKGKIITWTIKCTSCSYKDVDVTDEVKEDAERKQKKTEDWELLKKYRDECCLTKEEGEKHLRMFEEMAFAKEVYEYEIFSCIFSGVGDLGRLLFSGGCCGACSGSYFERSQQPQVAADDAGFGEDI